MSRSLRLAPTVLALAVALAAAPALAGPREDEQARNATRVLNEIQAIPESAIPDKLLGEARAIVVLPDTIKAGLFVGGRRGRGVLSVRTADGTWSNPSFVTFTGGSLGFQAGVQSSDIVLVFRGERGLDSIVNGKFTLGADAGVAAGPLGRNASAATDGELKAEIWSWSRARGLFAGVALDGAVLSIDDAANEAVYGRDTTPRMIFEDRAGQAPSDDVAAFRELLDQATSSARTRRSDAPPAPAGTVSPTVVTPPAAGSVEASPATVDPADAPAQAEPLP